jgi:PAS domain S-box-containing protein
VTREEFERQTELFEATQELVAVGGWEYDLDAETLYWTDEVRRIHDLPSEYEPTVQEAIEFYHPADRPAVRSAMEAAIDHGEPFESEWRLQTAAGNQRWVRVQGKPQRDGGSTVRLQGALTDITEQKRHQTRLNTLFETTRDLLHGATTEEVAAVAVEAADDVLGLSINGVYLYDEQREVLAPAASTAEATELIGEIPTFESGEGVSWEVFESGEPRIYDDVRTAPNVYNPATGIRSELHLPLGDHGVFLAGSTEPDAFGDRTVSLAKILAANVETALDQLAHETELRETSDRLEAIIQHTPDALFVLDDDERIIEANDQACRSLGYGCDCAALLGRHWSEIGTVTEDGDPSSTTDPLATLRENPETVLTVTGRHARHDGSTFPVRVRIARIDHDAEGEFLAIARDISEIRAQQRQLRRQNEQLDQFASVISHDLRSPLSVARAGVEVARRTGEGHGDSLERVGRAHDRMETLIENLLTLARNGQTMDETDLDAVDLSAVTTRSWDTVSTDGAELRVEDDLRLIADESRLRQLVENLFRNSVEHGSTSSRTQSGDSVEHGSTSSRAQPDDSVEHGSTDSRPETDDGSKHSSDDLTVRVGLHQDGFYIEDDGPGIADADRDRIFEPGYTTQDGGTGYGLEIVRTVAEAHDWEITVTDATTGGARFEITGVDTAESGS